MFFKALERIKSIGVRHAGKQYTPEGLTHLIRMQFRDPKLVFSTERDSRVESGNFWIKGEYRPADDEQDEPCIYITLTYPSRKRVSYISKTDWDSMGFHIADVVTHEYLHQYYCRQRGYRHGRGYRAKTTLRYSESMQDYLGCEDEIQAHGFNVASEMLVYNRPMEKTKTYRLYQRHFRQDQKVVLQLKRQASKYIKQWEQNHEQSNTRTRSRHK
jgi:hypothetical protein